MSLKPKQESPQPRLIIIAAPSGAGKTTLCDMLLKEFPNITLSISTTTRAKRPYEEEAKHYYFVTPEEFQKKIDAGQFAEWATVHDNLYGTWKAAIDKALAKGQHLLFDIDVQGAFSLKKSYGNRTLLIFIQPPSMEELQKRLVGRKGDTPASIEKRLQNAYNELAWSQKFDFQITNDNLQKAYANLRQIILQECTLKESP